MYIGPYTDPPDGLVVGMSAAAINQCSSERLRPSSISRGFHDECALSKTMKKNRDQGLVNAKLRQTQNMSFSSVVDCGNHSDELKVERKNESLLTNPNMISEQ